MTRAEGETIVIDGGRIVLTVVDVRGKSRRVRIGIEAVKNISVDRGEVHKRKQEQSHGSDKEADQSRGRRGPP